MRFHSARLPQENCNCGGSCGNPGAANAVFPGGWGDEQWFGIFEAKANGRKNSDDVIVFGKLNGVPDILTPRAAVVVFAPEN